MRSGLALASLALLALPTAASAATVSGKTHQRGGTTFGVMHYRPSAGVANRVVVEPLGRHEFRVRDRAERVRAAGACRQDGRHAAICPWTESDANFDIRVYGGNDRVEVRGHASARVKGGDGDDVLIGRGDVMYGERGDDVLIGAPGRAWDRLSGGPGRDRLDGRGHSTNYLSDTFYDHESDEQAARDVYIGGKNARAHVDYSIRLRGLRIDLHDRRIAPEGDRISGVKSVTGGFGNDVLIGTGGPNTLEGGGGRDRLYGRGSADWLRGGPQNDRLYGGSGNDRLDEAKLAGGRGNGRDLLVGGRGRDDMTSLEATYRRQRDEVVCDSRDLSVETDALDRLRGCARMKGWDIGQLEMRVQPDLTAEGAAFVLSCSSTETEQPDPSTFIHRCRGRLTVRRPGGEEFGTEEFSFPTPDHRTGEVTVTVPLTADGRRAIERGSVIEVEAEALSSNGWRITPAGYRAFVRD